MAERTAAGPRIVGPDGTVTALTAIDLDDRRIDEGWLQDLLDRSPDVIPIDEIDGVGGPLISLGRELGVGTGFVDNAFVSPAGELVIVEAKLWRNHEARRKVVAQVLDYAASVSGMSYSEFDAVVRDACDTGSTIWARVQAHLAGGPSSVAEAVFVDALSRNLAAGRFVLLIAGDGIRSELDDLADLLEGHPHLGFHLRLIELKPFFWAPGEDGDTQDWLLVVPRVVGRTVEITRSVIEIRNRHAEDIDVVVSVPPAESQTVPRKRTKLNEIELLHQMSANLGQADADATSALLAWWRTEPGSTVFWNDTSVELGTTYEDASGRMAKARLMLIFTDGTGRGYPKDLADDLVLMSRKIADGAYSSLGFAGNQDWPEGQLHLAEPGRSEQVRNVLGQLAKAIVSVA